MPVVKIDGVTWKVGKRGGVQRKSRKSGAYYYATPETPREKRTIQSLLRSVGPSRRSKRRSKRKSKRRSKRKSKTAVVRVSRRQRGGRKTVPVSISSPLGISRAPKGFFAKRERFVPEFELVYPQMPPLEAAAEIKTEKEVASVLETNRELLERQRAIKTITGEFGPGAGELKTQIRRRFGLEQPETFRRPSLRRGRRRPSQRKISLTEVVPPEPSAPPLEPEPSAPAFPRPRVRGKRRPSRRRRFVSAEAATLIQRERDTKAEGEEAQALAATKKREAEDEQLRASRLQTETDAAKAKLAAAQRKESTAQTNTTAAVDEADRAQQEAELVVAQAETLAAEAEVKVKEEQRNVAAQSQIEAEVAAADAKELADQKEEQQKELLAELEKVQKQEEEVRVEAAVKREEVKLARRKQEASLSEEIKQEQKQFAEGFEPIAPTVTEKELEEKHHAGEEGPVTIPLNSQSLATLYSNLGSLNGIYTSFYDAYLDEYRPPDWSRDNTMNSKDYKLHIHEAVASETNKVKLLWAATQRVPTYLNNQTKLFRAKTFQNRFGYSVSAYQTYFNQTGKLLPNVGTIVDAKIRVGTTGYDVGIFGSTSPKLENVQIYNATAYDFATEEEPDYQVLVLPVKTSSVWTRSQKQKVVKILMQLYLQMWINIFSAAQKFELTHVIMSPIGIDFTNSLPISPDEFEKNVAGPAAGLALKQFPKITPIFTSNVTTASPFQERVRQIVKQKFNIIRTFPKGVLDLKKNTRWDFSKMLIVNATSPHNIPGNGHRGQNSLDSNLGSITNIATSFPLLRPQR